MKRKFLSITRKISHPKSGDVVATFDGIMSYYSFSFYKEENKVHYRYLTCSCDNCLNRKAGDCVNKYLCGEEHVYEFKKPKPKKRKPIKPRKPQPAPLSSRQNRKRGSGAIYMPRPHPKRQRIDKAFVPDLESSNNGNDNNHDVRCNVSHTDRPQINYQNNSHNHNRNRC